MIARHITNNLRTSYITVYIYMTKRHILNIHSTSHITVYDHKAYANIHSTGITVYDYIA